MNSSKKDLMMRINQTGDYNDEIESGLKSGIAEFKKNHTW
jgi:F-type H+-transporting ATPase subunit alpha